MELSVTTTNVGVRYSVAWSSEDQASFIHDVQLIISRSPGAAIPFMKPSAEAGVFVSLPKPGQILEVCSGNKRIFSGRVMNWVDGWILILPLTVGN